MIGLTKLTIPNGQSLFINPNHISFFTPSTKEFCKMLNEGLVFMPNTTLLAIGNMAFQVKESDADIIRALTRLRQKQEQNVLDLKKRADREDWMGDDDG